MNALIIYMIKAAIYLAGFYLIYYFFLSSDTMHSRNRVFIILSVAVSFILPVLAISVREQSSIFYFGKTLSEVIVTEEGGKVLQGSASGADSNGASLLFRIYFAGIILACLKFIIDLINLMILIKRHKRLNEYIIYFKGLNTSGFSAMGHIFINRCLSDDEAAEIIRHEQNHLDHNHFLDILFIEVAIVLQWFNPFMYLFNRSLRAIHEYQADEGCLNSGMPVIKYQNLLLNNVFRSGKINFSNSFSNPSLIRKRMIMMSKDPSGNFTSLKILLAVPVVVFSLAAISACEQNIDLIKPENTSILQDLQPDPTIEINSAPVFTKPEIKQPLPAPEEFFVTVEQMPQFPGGDNAMMNFINRNIVYPDAAKEKNIQGRVILRFAVMATGLVDKITIIKSVDQSLDEEAVKVIKMFPRWTPGSQGGKPVNVWYSVPVTFQLR